MDIAENIPLSKLTTFKVGGAARFVATCRNVEDIQTALAFARERSLPWYVIGGGSNILVHDGGFAGVIIQPLVNELSFEDVESACVVTVGAGVVWDTLVQESVARGLWGLENLAGIPGCVGGAPVQNIGAYGADVSDTLVSVEAFDTKTNTLRKFSKEECLFGYRDSRFKRDASFIITRVALSLSAQGTPHTNYADLTALTQAGETLDTSEAIAYAVRKIRARKFPDLNVSGTAGSFFKNPIISSEKYAVLQSTYPDLPGFPVGDEVKVPLGWILDHALNLRGYTKGHVRLFERQALVLVAEAGATANDVEDLAKEVEEKVKEATGISIEREVRML